jgi:hypothetical protein
MTLELLMMKNRSFENRTHLSSSAPSEALIDAASEPMARSVLANATQYLDGARPDFTAQFILSDLAHKAAANKFAGWLLELGFGEPEPLARWQDVLHETGNEKKYHRFVVVARAAQLNERNIIVEESSLMPFGTETALPHMVRYMSGTEQLLDVPTTEADQA